METQTIQFDLVSPEEKLISGPVTMAVIPGEDGELGVGAGHASILSSLKAGVVALYMEGEAQPRRIFVAGGFADVTGTSCTILAEEAINVAALDQKELEQKLKNLGEDLGLAQEESDKARISRDIKLVKAKLQALTGQLML